MNQQQAEMFHNLYDFWPPGFGPLAIPPWVPTYDGPFTVTSENGIIVTLTPFNFATKETAMELMKRFGADRIAEIPWEGAGGPNSGPTHVRWLVWLDGTAIKAGPLASHFTLNPENLFPNVAANECLHDIADARTTSAKLPTA